MSQHYSSLLFTPLDVTILTNLKVRLAGENKSHRQPFWSTHDIIGKETGYIEYKWLFDQLPFTTLEIFTHKIQKTIALEHIDHDLKSSTKEKIELIKSVEPAGYHIVLSGKNDSLEIFDGKNWITTILPSVPMAYALNLTSCLHRVKADILRTTLYIEGTIDNEKHYELLNRSLKKYKEFAIYNISE